MLLFVSLTEPVPLPHPQGGPLIKLFVLHGTSWGARAAKSNELKRPTVSDYIGILRRSHSLLIPRYSWWTWLRRHLIFVVRNFSQLGYEEAELGKGSCKAARCLAVFDLQGLQLPTFSFVASSTCFRDCWRL